MDDLLNSESERILDLKHVRHEWVLQTDGAFRAELGKGFEAYEGFKQMIGKSKVLKNESLPGVLTASATSLT